ncbi:pilin N-terminal domain-containing protein [Anaerococcus vaginimassiliensis]|uniref:pilin N-terminal domain-containing protein n=1 Tax=Anaerococcus vaginimassiliensis TaxID=2042308 RepID=UPI00103011AE|nr:pilin N-terminal domain-containing protein [Anaerococcus vaginimassiliensis]
MKNKLFSIFTALAMVLGILVSPFTSAHAADEVTNSVTLHKMLIDKDNLDQFPKEAGQEGLDKSIYDGNALKNGYFGANAKDIGGVYFAWAKKDTDGEYYWADKDGNIIGEKKEEADTRVKAEKGKYKDMPENTYGGLTEDNNGFKFNTAKFSGTYKIFEIESKSTYVGENNDSTLTGSKAVPVEITLPLVNEKGVIADAHVYPKNTEDKPTTNKDFSNKFDQTTPNGRDYNTDETEVQGNPEISEKEKKEAWEPKNVGDKVDYTVKTTIPANARYATAYWNDEMTDGLTLDINSVKLAYTGNDNVTLTIDQDYTIKPTSNGGKQGFELEFTPTGLEKINNKPNEGTITITYSATLNENAVVAVPESNDVNFFYGNNPRKGNTPKPNYPDENGNLKVTKTWDDGVWAEGESATFRLVDAQTGKMVTADDLVQGNATKEDFEAYKKEFKSEQKIGYNQEDKTATWKYLDKNKQYKAVEIDMTAGTESSYEVNNKGEIVVVNHKTNNPAPINPTEPKVVTYGAKFVKTNADGTERLADAEFAVKNSEGKFLTGTAADRTAYQAAQDAYLAKIEEYNGKKAEEQTDELKAEIKKLEEARDKAWNATLKDMTQWGDKDNAIKLKSNKQGQFEIAGLAPGKYTLVETKAPEGYVNAEKATLEFEFEVTKDGQKLKNIDFGVKDDKEADNAQQVINKKVTIPQTGGIGSLIFVVAGLAIMTFAYTAYKKSQYQEA